MGAVIPKTRLVDQTYPFLNMRDDHHSQQPVELTTYPSRRRIEFEIRADRSECVEESGVGRD